MKPTRRIWLLALPVIVLTGLVARWLWPEPDPIFHGKRESAWIGEIWPMPFGYSLAELQYEQWIEFGPEGLLVLARGLDREWRKANSPWNRLYQKAHHHFGPHVPFMPAPDDPGGRKRQDLIQLLSSPSIQRGKGMVRVDESVARALRDREVNVRILAIHYFTGGGENRLNDLDDRLKRKLLPEFIRAMERENHPSLRAGASLALGYYPEAAEIVTPVLEAALLDPHPQVQLFAAGSLQRVNPDRARGLDAVAVPLRYFDHPNKGYGGVAVGTLREFQTEPERVVPVLIEALGSAETQAGALLALERFMLDHGHIVIPALRQAAQRDNEIGGNAAAVLERLRERTPAPFSWEW